MADLQAVNQELSNLIVTHPEAVTAALDQFGFTEISPKNVTLAYIRHQSDFSDALADFLGDSFDGMNASGTPADRKKDRRQQIGNVLDTVINVLEGGKAVLDLTKKKEEGKEPIEPKPNPKPESKKETIMGLPNPLFYGLTAVVVLILIYLGIRYAK